MEDQLENEIEAALYICIYGSIPKYGDPNIDPKIL